MKTIEVKHLLIENPLTERMVNIMPLFELMNNRNESTKRGPVELVATIDTILRYVTTNISEQVDIADVELICIRLYEMRDAFCKMNEYK